MAVPCETTVTRNVITASDITVQMTSLLQHEDILNDAVMHLHQLYIGKIDSGVDVSTTFVAGSISEGSSSARLFGMKTGDFAVEMDIMYPVFTLTPEQQSEVLTSDRGAGVKVTWKHDLMHEIITHEYYKHCIGQLVTEKNLLDGQNMIPYDVLVSLKKMFAGTDGRTEKLLQNVNTLFANLLPKANSGTLKLRESESRASLEMSFEQQYDDKLLILSLDLVIAITLIKWPQQAEAWVHRSRVWPSQRLVDDIVSKGCHLVPRVARGDDNHSPIWRLSFSKAEMVLTKERTNQQKAVYLLVKSIFYKFIKPVTKDVVASEKLSTYLVKTTMMWLCEEKAPVNAFWDSNNILNAVTELLQRFKGYLDSRYLEHYFVSGVNILEHISDDVMQKSAFVVGTILNDLPTKLLDMPFKDVLRSSDMFATRCKNAADMVDMYFRLGGTGSGFSSLSGTPAAVVE